MKLTKEEKKFIYNSMDWYVKCCSEFSPDTDLKHVTETAIAILQKMGIADMKMDEF